MIWALVLVFASGTFEITTGFPDRASCTEKAQLEYAKVQKDLVVKAVCMDVRKITT